MSSRVRHESAQMGTMRDLFVQTKTFALFLACITIKNRLPVPLPLEPGIQEIVDEIYDALCELLPWPQALEMEHLWYEIRIFTVGDPKTVEKDLAAYLEAVRRSKSKDEG